MTDGKIKDIVVSLGNEFRGDDGAGMYFGEIIASETDITVIRGGDAPENVTGPIVKQAPDRIIIADALDFGGGTGECRCVSSDRHEGAGISTHGSLKLFIDYLKVAAGAPVYILGFQPASMTLGDDMSEEMRAAVHKTARNIIASGGFDSAIEKCCVGDCI